LITQTLIDDIAKKLLGSTGNDLKAILKAIIQQAGLQIPGFAQGGVIEGTPGSLGTLARLGEFGRSEAVLPLQDSPALQRLLHNPRVLNPVLAALPKISLPTPRGMPTAALPSPTRGGGGNKEALLRSEQRAQSKELAGLIADALVERGFSGGTTLEEGAIQITVPPSGDPALDARKTRRLIEDTIKKHLR
jgi:hypothetical protein